MSLDHLPACMFARLGFRFSPAAYMLFFPSEQRVETRVGNRRKRPRERRLCVMCTIYNPELLLTLSLGSPASPTLQESNPHGLPVVLRERSQRVKRQTSRDWGCIKVAASSTPSLVLLDPRGSCLIKNLQTIFSHSKHRVWRLSAALEGKSSLVQSSRSRRSMGTRGIERLRRRLKDGACCRTHDPGSSCSLADDPRSPHDSLSAVAPLLWLPSLVPSYQP